MEGWLQSPPLLELLAQSAFWLPNPPDGVATWWYVTALALAAIILGMAKSGFGGGIGILAVPLTANVLPADLAVGVLLPMLLVGDVFASGIHRKNVDWPTVRPLLAGAVIGIALGTGVLLLLEDVGSLTRALNVTVGGICLGLVLIQGWRLMGRSLPHVPPTPPAAVVTGGVSGVISTLAHSAGPVAAVYLLEIKLDKRKLVATAAWLFFLINLLKLPTYVGLGLITPATLVQSAWAALAIPVGTLLGVWAHQRIPERPFTAVIYLTAAVAAGRMIWKAFA